MDYNKFEDHIKKTLHNREEAVDVSKIMGAVDASQKSGRKGLVILLATILLFSSFTVGYLVYDTDSEGLAAASESDVEQASHNILNSKDSRSEEERLQDRSMILQARDSEIHDQLNPATKQELSSSSSLQPSTSKVVDVASISTKVKYSSVTARKSQVTKSDNKFLRNDSFTETSARNSFESFNNVTFAKQEEAKSFNYKNESLEKIAIEKLVNTGEILFTGTPQNVECPSFNQNPWIFEIGTIMGVSDPVKRFSINPTEINPALTSRAENEKSLEGLDLEFNLSAKRMRWPVFIKSGVSYSRWTERMSLEREYTEIDTVQGIISATVSQTGDTVTYIYGDIFIETDYDIKKKVHYYINRVNIPLSLVYEREFGDNAFQAELGASFNIRTFSAGSVYESENTFTPVNIGNFFSSLTGVSYFTKAHYRRYISDHMFVGVLAHFHYLPAEFSNRSSFSQKYLNYGLGIYGGYRF